MAFCLFCIVHELLNYFKECPDYLPSTIKNAIGIFQDVNRHTLL